MSRQRKVHPLDCYEKLKEDKVEMKEVNHYENFANRDRKSSWQKLGKQIASVSQWKTYRNSMRGGSNDRKLELPRTPLIHKKTKDKKTAQCVLDSDVDDLGKDNFSTYDSFLTSTIEVANQALVSSRTMIIYFAKLARASYDEPQEIEFEFLEQLLDKGADINFTDRHGQTIFHEVARIWDVDVAKFVLENGGDVNVADRYGRTPLHVAAAVDYPEMVQFLIASNANIHARTAEELQTPTHYAAKNDAAKALKVLLKLGGNFDCTDYKGRTPLQVAAELDRSETTKLLVDKGVHAGVQDDSGSSAISMMISKMPTVAKEALNQFHSTDRVNRRQYYHLNYLEPCKPGKQGIEWWAKTPLQCVVHFKQMDIIMHPVFQRLIHVKWQQFGRRGVAWQVIVQLLYVLIWTALAITLHIGRKASYYYPPSKYWWRIVLETIAGSMTIYFILQEFLELRISKTAHSKWQRWRVRELEKDLKFCHPRWPEERKYLEMELKEISETGISYFNDAWNYFDWITYGWVVVIVVTRGLAVGLNMKSAKYVHPRLFAVGIIFIWLRLMKAFRAYASIGPFIVMIGHIIDDTLKFAFLYLEFYFPYVCAFWILFGGETMKLHNQPANGLDTFNDLMYTVWQLTYVGNFPWDPLMRVDHLMAQLLCGTYIAISGIILLNLFIALMSDTFQRVYDNAKANAAMQRASIILNLEEAMGESTRDAYRRIFHVRLAPEEMYYDDDSTTPDSGELERMTHQIKDVVDEVYDIVRDSGSNSNSRTTTTNKDIMRLRDDMASVAEQHETSMNEMRQEITEVKQLLEVLVRNLQHQNTTSSNVSLQRTQQKIAKPLRSASSRTPHHKKHRKDQSLQSQQDDLTHEEPYQGLPLPPTTAELLLPSVSAITGRKAP